MTKQAAVLPHLERAFAVAVARKTATAPMSVRDRMGRRGGTRVGAIAIAAVLASGTAMAATGVWDPGIGDQAISGAPSISHSPVPTAATEALGVLRRPPSARDHGKQVRTTLHEISKGVVEGVRPDSVRYLASGAHGVTALGGEATILLSAHFHSPSSGGHFTRHGDFICVFRPLLPGRPGVDASSCFALADVLAGKALATDVYLASPGFVITYGLVPDGVTSVTAQYRKGPNRQVAVANNYFEIDTRGQRTRRPQRVVWHGSGGAVISQHPAAGS